MRLPRLLKSVSFRLAAFYAAAFGASVLVLGTVIYFTASAAFDNQIHARMAAESSALLDIYRQSGLTGLRAAIATRQGHRLYLGLEYGIYDARGVLREGTLPPARPASGWSHVTGPPDGDEEPGDDEEMMVVATPLPGGEMLAVGDDLQSREEFDEAILKTFGLGLALSLTLAAAGGALVSSLFLRRVDAITQSAEAIIQGDMAHRIALRGTGDDLDALSTTLNRMLDRIASLVEAMRQVTNDVAHDLRTPIGRLRQSLDDARRAPASEAELRDAMSRAIDQTDSILATFAALLRIAQVEAGSRRAGFRTVDLSALVEGIVQTFAPAAEDAGMTLTATIAPGVTTVGDAELLTQMIVNLVENALAHTSKGTRIAIALSPTAAIAVSDDGPGIPPDARGRIFQRFYRLDASRRTGGSGLGLSLVAAIAELHGAAIALDNNAPGLRVTVSLSCR
ncbi:MAG TPA: HAMP domain-containing sensor histidine kinase [Rhizomicrobium sp.]|nr:HAMP domain-containing sensor histidine kinase [Rhizomicrobium sp.]